MGSLHNNDEGVEPQPHIIQSATGTNPVFETMTTFKVANWLIRVWRECNKWTMGPDPEVVEVLTNVERRFHGFYAVDFVEAVCKLPRISAIEILDKKSKNGGLYYSDWK